MSAWDSLVTKKLSHLTFVAQAANFAILHCQLKHPMSFEDVEWLNDESQFKIWYDSYVIYIMLFTPPDFGGNFKENIVLSKGKARCTDNWWSYENHSLSMWVLKIVEV